MVHESFKRTVPVLLVDLTIACCPLMAQTVAPPASAPTFEVASIRQNNNPDPHWSMNFTADGVHATDVTLSWAVHEAFGIYDSNLWSF
jgi:hypothetical protein